MIYVAPGENVTAVVERVSLIAMEPKYRASWVHNITHKSRDANFELVHLTLSRSDEHFHYHQGTCSKRAGLCHRGPQRV